MRDTIGVMVRLLSGAIMGLMLGILYCNIQNNWYVF